MDAEIEAVRVAGTPDGPVPVVTLAVDDEAEVVPIFVGFEEARAIVRGMDATDVGRPLTHDLLLDVVEELGGRVDHVVVSEVTDEGTYVADLHVDTPRGETVIDARPSDSLALAARTNADLEISASVFEESSQPAEEFERLEDIRNVEAMP